MWISIDKYSNIPLLRQIYSQIKDQICDGTLGEGTRLPSTRALASELGVSRNTVLEAYDQLTAEGYLNSQHGSGTTVAYGAKINFDKCARNISVEKSAEKKKDYIDFRSGVPDLSCFPNQTFARLYHHVCTNMPAKEWGYGELAGDIELRQAICIYLLHSRGLHCKPGNIIIVSGATQGLSLISRITSRNHITAIMEDPTHPGLKKVIEQAGLKIIPSFCDYNGLVTNAIPNADRPAFIYTTPSHQYPLGSILPAARRSELINYARVNNTIVVEDDYDSEFRYKGQPVNTLYELDPDHVVYIGSFSKILSPALRLGYIILPDRLIKDFITEKKYSDVHSEVITQRALARFILNDDLEKHVRKMKKLYNEKRKLLIEQLEEQFNNTCVIHGDASGLHIVVEFPWIGFNSGIVTRLQNKGVKIYPLLNYFSSDNTNDHSHELLMGYGHLYKDEIIKGIEILSLELRQS